MRGAEEGAEQRSAAANQTASPGIEVRTAAGLGTQGNEEAQEFMALRSCTNGQIWFLSESNVPSFFPGKIGVLQGEAIKASAICCRRIPYRLEAPLCVSGDGALGC